MKKMLMLSAVLLGTAVASQAGVNVHIGIPLPPLPRIIIGAPAPRVIVHGPRVAYPPVCAPAPVYVPPPVYAPAPVYMPRPRVVYAPPYAYHSCRRGCRHPHHHHHHR